MRMVGSGMGIAHRIHHGQELLQHADGGIGTNTPFLMDDATLVVNILIGEQQVASPVVENQQTRIYGGRNGSYRYIIYIIYGLVDAGIGIEILTKLHTDTLTILDDAIAGEVLGTIEAHVLQKMCQSALVLLFKDRAYLLSNVEVGLTLGLSIVTDIIRHSILKFAHSYGRVNRNRLTLLGISGAGKQQCCCQKTK